MDPLTLAFTAASTLISGAGLILQALPYFLAKSKYEALRLALDGLKFEADEFTESKTLNISKPQPPLFDEQEHRRLISYLDIGEVMLPLVRQRAFTRITIVAIVSLLAIMMVPFNFHERAVFAGHPSFEWQDVVILFGVALGPYVAFVRRFLLSEDESLFLKNLQNLHEEFYRREVAPRLALFNYKVKLLFPSLPDVSKKELEQLQTHLDALQETLQKRLTLMFEEKKKLAEARHDSKPD